MSRFIPVLACLALAGASACAVQQKQVEQQLQSPGPVNCATAEGDIRVLQSEKTHVGKQIEAGITSIVPIGLVAGVASGTEGTNLKVATGEYNKMIDNKIAEIKQACGIR